MTGGLPELAVRAVQDVAADRHYPHVLLDYVGELLLRETLPQRGQLRLHVVLYAVTEYFVFRIHPMRSFFFARPSFRLYFCLRLLADVDDSEVVVGGLELPRYLEFRVSAGVNPAARQPRQRLNAVELASSGHVEAQLQALPLHVRLTGDAACYEHHKR